MALPEIYYAEVSHFILMISKLSRIVLEKKFEPQWERSGHGRTAPSEIMSQISRVNSDNE